MEAFSHGAVFPGDLDEVSAALDEEVAIMAEIFQEANHILCFQSEQAPSSCWISPMSLRPAKWRSCAR